MRLVHGCTNALAKETPAVGGVNVTFTCGNMNALVPAKRFISDKDLQANPGKSATEIAAPQIILSCGECKGGWGDDTRLIRIRLVRSLL